MAKITQVTVTSNKKPVMSLLRYINEETDAVRGGAEDEGALPAKARPDSTTAGDSKLDRVASEAMFAPTGERRVVIFLNRADLPALYLKQGGSELAERIDDAEATDFASNPEGDTTRFRVMPKNFKFADMVQVPSNEYAHGADTIVLVDAPNKVIADLVAAGTDAKKAKAAIKNIIDHKHYVMTLSAKGAAAAAADLSSGDEDKVRRAFNPAKLMLNYPIKQIRIAAQNEWDALAKDGDAEAAVGSKASGDKASAAGDVDDTRNPAVDAEGKLAATARGGDTTGGDDKGSTVVKKDLDHAEMMNQLRGLWDAWTESGRKASPEMRRFIKQMWLDSGGVKAEGLLRDITKQV
jgi:hypothetical protein